MESSRVRHEWVSELTKACHAFVVRVNESEHDEFSAAVSAFAATVPAPASYAEHLVLRDRVFACAVQAGIDFHQRYHRTLEVRCPQSPAESAVAFLQPLRRHPAEIAIPAVLDRWTAEYLSAFDRHHDWPGAVRAAAILRREVQRKHNVRTLARRAGASRSVLSDEFKQLYGMTMSEYHARARMVAAVISLRTPGSNVDAVAREVGYRSAKNFYIAFRKLTGRTPGAIRTLSESSLEQLLLRNLTLPRWLA